MRYFVLLVLVLISTHAFAALDLVPIETEIKIYDVTDPWQSFFGAFEQLQGLTFARELSTEQIGGRLARSGRPIVKSVDVIVRDIHQGYSVKRLSTFEEVSEFFKAAGNGFSVQEVKATVITAKSYLSFCGEWLK